MTQPAALPQDEAARLACLISLSVLDTDPDPTFEQITRLAATLCESPIALVSLVDAERQWFKSNLGLSGVRETHRDLAFCAHAILSDSLMEVVDATKDPRFADNPLVVGGPRIRFYAGAPLKMPTGERLGTLCVIDRVPRQLTATQQLALQGLAGMVTTSLMERKDRLVLSRELERTEARYRLIVEGQSELVSLADLSGTLTYVNAAYAEFFGLSRGNMLGRSLLDFVAEADRKPVADHLRAVAEAGHATSGVNRMMSADGRERWVAWTNRCVSGVDREGFSIHSVGRDITEQRRAEQALADNETRGRLLYDATPAMLHSIDPQGRLLNVTDTWLRSMGYRREEVVGRASAEFLTPESARRAREVVLPAFFSTGRCDDVEYQMVRKDGSVMNVLLSAVLERNAEGQAIRSLAVLRDITELQATAASLTETTHLLRLVLDSLPARISYWDAGRLNRFANRAFLDWFGVKQNFASGKHAREVLGPDAYARIELQINAGLAGVHGQVEVSSLGPDGNPRTTDMRFTPDLRDDRVCGLFVIALDITAQRQAEREVREQEHRLKLLVDGVRDHAIYMLDPSGRVATWNSGAERAKGYVAAQVIGKPYAMFFTAEDVAAGEPVRALARAASDGRFETEGWRVRADGSRFWAGAMLSALHDDAGRLIGYAKITRDLTELKRQQALLVRVVDLAPCAMLMVNPAGQIVMVNAQAESTFGYARADLLGQPVEMLLPLRVRHAHQSLRGAFLADPSARAMGMGRELFAVRRNGEEFPIEIGLGPIDGAGGISTLAAVFDISERRHQQAATELALAEKETLLREVYHRVKNNLQVVQSLLSIQRHSLPEGAARDALHHSVQRVRAMALVHEKLYQSGNLAGISLRAYTSDLLAQIADAHGIDHDSVKLHSDIVDMETRLDSAVPYGLLVTELVTNSLKHGFPSGGRGAVQVTLVRRDDGHLLTISDTGIGFDVGAKVTGDPTSMGLRVAESLAGQLGGHLQTHSGAGATTTVLLTKL